MDDKEPLLDKVEEAIKDAAKKVEDFADEVAAPEVPPVLIPDPDVTSRPPGARERDGQDK